jgi:putative transposase
MEVYQSGNCVGSTASDASFCTWRAKFGGMTIPDAKRLRDPEAENTQLKKLLAESLLDAEALKVALGRKY